MNDQIPEYVSSVTLMVLGESLDPDAVSAALKLKPSQCWRKGERSVRLGDGTRRLRDSTHQWGGWKLFVADEQRNMLLEEQLEFWVGLLRPRTASLRQLRLLGLECALDIFVTSGTTASIVLSTQLQKDVTALGLELRVSFVARPGSEQAVAADRPKTGAG